MHGIQVYLMVTFFILSHSMQPKHPKVLRLLGSADDDIDTDMEGSSGSNKKYKQEDASNGDYANKREKGTYTNVNFVLYNRGIRFQKQDGSTNIKNKPKYKLSCILVVASANKCYGWNLENKNITKHEGSKKTEHTLDDQSAQVYQDEAKVTDPSFIVKPMFDSSYRADHQDCDMYKKCTEPQPKIFKLRSSSYDRKIIETLRIPVATKQIPESQRKTALQPYKLDNYTVFLFKK